MNTKNGFFGNMASRFLTGGMYLALCFLTVSCPNDDLFSEIGKTHFIVTFDSGEGVTTLASPTTMRIDLPAKTLSTLPAAPKKPGYFFDGWWTQPDSGGSEITASTEIMDDLTVYARWDAAPLITVTFNAQGGTPSSGSKTVLYNDEYGSLQAVSKDGYIFLGWWTGLGGAGNLIDMTSEVSTASDHTLYAFWGESSFLVSFDAQGGSATDPISKTVNYAEPYGELPGSERTGYTFGGWWTEAGGAGSQISALTTVTATAAQTLYAKWTGNTYTVTFNANGGSSAGPATKDVVFGQDYGALASTSRTGYTFLGWYTSSTGGTLVESTADVVAPENHTLYAQWSVNSYTVSFDAQGGSATDPSSKTVTYDATYGELPSTARTGYAFGGWWTEEGGAGSQISALTTVTATATHTLYAKWSGNTYTVTFDAQSGITAAPTSKIVTYGSPYGTLAATSRSGFIFSGWWTGTSGTGTRITTDSYVTNSANHTLYAYWTVTYMINNNISSGSFSLDIPQAVFSDTSYLYVGGNDGNSHWRLERRHKASGALATGWGDSSTGIVTSISGTNFSDFASDGTYLYHIGEEGSAGNYSIRIEKRAISTGSLETAFDYDGIITVNPTAGNDYGSAIAVDGNYMYCVETQTYDTGNSLIEWRIEKRDKTTGALVAGFGSSGVVLSRAGTGSAFAKSILTDGTYLYIGGYDDSSGTRNWRVEKRLITTGALVTSFDSDGKLQIAGTDDYVMRMVFSGSDIVLAGRTNDPSYSWRVEKRSSSTGALVTGFGSNGVVALDPSPNNESIRGFAIYDGNIYLAGSDASTSTDPRWLVYKLLASTGALVPAFGSSGKLTIDVTSGNDCVTGVAVDSSELYLIGYSDASPPNLDFQWNISKRKADTGGL